ncbi:iron-sulfur cluster assembly scaffold protein [Ahrensia sp. R2A130]|uniref:iron-sulfur cluster assembly scaffold protein n=1 Tax=Ahrensia sp. R2A130 TaxID=744979 RepID=UPI00058E7FFF|nr:iron-sulfur cluster assembly scaffold protein [Ahrensia sp. R2A130]
MSIDSVYNAKILEYAGNIGSIGRLDAPDGTAKAHSKLCGSTVTVDLSVEDGRIAEYAQDVKACALGQASAAIFAKDAVGRSLVELEALKARMHAMLKDGGEPPEAPFDELKFLEPVREYRARHASTLLVFDAAVDAMKQAVSQERSVA